MGRRDMCPAAHACNGGREVGRGRLWLGRGARGAMLAATTGLGVWGLAQNPFAQPLIERGADSASRAVEAAFRNSFTPGWLDQALRDALAAAQPERVIWLADLAQDEGVALPEDLRPQIDDIRAEQASLWNNVKECGICAYDIASCGSISAIALCAIPVEMTPAGDLNALRRQGMAALKGQEVDRLEAGLALAGMAATAAILFSGGSSAAVKAGASTARMARRLGNLSPGMTRSLGELANLPVNWGAVLRRAPLEQITDVAQLSRLGGVAADMGRIARSAGPAETLLLLRHVDSAEDAARMARAATIAGPRTLSRVEVLGKARLFRAMMRLSDLALGTLAALYAAATQVLLMLAGALGRRLTRR